MPAGPWNVTPAWSSASRPCPAPNPATTHSSHPTGTPGIRSIRKNPAEASGVRKDPSTAWPSTRAGPARTVDPSRLLPTVATIPLARLNFCHFRGCVGGPPIIKLTSWPWDLGIHFSFHQLDWEVNEPLPGLFTFFCLIHELSALSRPLSN